MGCRRALRAVVVDKLVEGHRAGCHAGDAGLAREARGEPMSMTQPEFARFVQGESESAARIIKAAGIKRQ